MGTGCSHIQMTGVKEQNDDKSKPQVIFITGNFNTKFIRIKEALSTKYCTQEYNLISAKNLLLNNSSNCREVLPSCELIDLITAEMVPNNKRKFLVFEFPENIENYEKWKEKTAEKFALKFVVYLKRLGVEEESEDIISLVQILSTEEKLITIDGTEMEERVMIEIQRFL